MRGQFAMQRRLHRLLDHVRLQATVTGQLHTLELGPLNTRRATTAFIPSGTGEPDDTPPGLHDHRVLNFPGALAPYRRTRLHTPSDTPDYPPGMRIILRRERPHPGAGHPHRRQEVCRQQLGQDRRVDPVFSEQSS
jgi:hypothetical protein